MNRLFIAEDTAALYRCYTPAQIGNSRVISAADFLAAPMDYRDVAYIFSTWGMIRLTEEQIRESFPNLKAVFYGAGSVNYFALPYLRCGVRVFSAWAANAIPVAEFTAAQIILAGKGYFQLPRRYREQGVTACRSYADSFPGNYGLRVGLLGLGQISRHVISLLKPLNVEILVYSNHLTQQQAEQLGIRKADLEEIFRTCQTISNHMANKPQTVGMLDARLFAMMKPNATFINTGRGSQVNMEDLKQAMRDFPDRTALLDVTDPVEPLPQEDDVWQIPNILITPHRAGSMEDEILRMGQYMIDEAQALSTGAPLHCEVVESMLRSMA